MIRCIIKVIVMALVLVSSGHQARALTKKKPVIAKEAKLTQMKVQLGAFLKGKPTTKDALTRWLLKTHLPGTYLQTLYAQHAKYLRNTIFALKNARFKGKHLRVFFAKQKWYKGKRDPRKIHIGHTAQKNVKQLLLVERIVPIFGRLVGRWPSSLDEKKGTYSFTFRNRRRFVQTPKSIQFYYMPPTNQRILLSSRLLMTIPREDIDGGKLKLRGYFKHFALLHAIGASDMQYIRIYNLRTKKLVFKRDGISGLAEFQLDRTQGQLLFHEEIGFPTKCTHKKKTYLAKESACWPLLQHKHPKLKGVSPPKCKCQGGLGPFVMGQFRLSIGKTLGKPIATGSIKCGCAS